MDREKAIREMPIYAGAIKMLDEEPETPEFVTPSRRMRHEMRKERFIRDHIVTVIIAALMLTEGMAVWFGANWKVRRDLEKKYEDVYDAKIAEYKSEQAYNEQATYWKSGEASLEAQINHEADLLSRVDIWTTDEAFRTFICNVWVRVKRGDYPGSVEEVLSQPKQYDFFSETKPIDAHRQTVATEMLRQLHRNVFPANLTLDHAWLEMQKDGAICVLHSQDKYYTRGDTTWKWAG